MSLLKLGWGLSLWVLIIWPIAILSNYGFAAFLIGDTYETLVGWLIVAWVPSLIGCLWRGFLNRLREIGAAWRGSSSAKR